MDKTVEKKSSTVSKSLTKSQQDKKNQKEKQKQTKDATSKKAEEERRKKEYEEKLRKVRVDYKDPHQLSEGEIMIVIEHSDDPGRVLMSTSHDYEKYKRIASKIRQWIMRDFPSMKVIIKPNNHQKDNSRIGCFEISYFHLTEGNLQRQDIFSKMVDRKWPKWKNVQEKIKLFVKKSNLLVKIHDISSEKKNKFKDLMIYIKNVLFEKQSNQNWSMGGSSMTGSMNASQAGHSGTQDLTNFKDGQSSEAGVVEFKDLPVGNYAIVFSGDRTYKPVEQRFQVIANEPEIQRTIELELVEEGFFSIEINTQKIQDKKAELDTQIQEIPLPPKQTPGEKSQLAELDKKRAELNAKEKKAKLYKISLLPSIPDRKEDDVSIPITCEKSNIPGGSDFLFESVIEEGNYDIILVDGAKNITLQKNERLTRGENLFVLDTVEEPKLVDYKQFKEAMEKKRKEDEEKRRLKEKQEDEGQKAGGASTGTGNAGAHAGRNRPDTSGTTMSESEEYHRLGSSDPRRPGSASIVKNQDYGVAHIGGSPQTIEEKKAEEEEDKFMVKMVTGSASDQLAFEMEFVYLDENNEAQEISEESPPVDGGDFQTDRNRQVITLTNVHDLEGYYRMVLRRLPGVPFSPVHVMVNCGGNSSTKKFSADPFFESESEQFYDYGVFRCSLY